MYLSVLYRWFEKTIWGNHFPGCINIVSCVLVSTEHILDWTLMSLWQHKYSFLWWTGLVGSKLDLITFLEQLNDPRSIRRMESTAVFPGMYEWMEMMTQIRGPRSSEEVILCQVVLEDHLWWKWFWKTWVCVHCCHRNVSVWTKSLLLSCEKLHSLVALPFLRGPRKTVPILSNCMTVLWKFLCTSRQKCVSEVVDKLLNF